MAVDTSLGAFLPTTDTFDRALIDQMDVNSREFKDFLVRLYQTTNNIALMTNIKDSGYYVTTEFVNGQLWFQDPALSYKTPNTKSPTFRQVFRKVVDFGVLPNATSKAVAHGITITANDTFTRFYGTATDTTGFTAIPLPYASIAAANQGIQMSLDATDVIIDTGAVDRTAYDTCYVVLEYIRE